METAVEWFAKNLIHTIDAKLATGGVLDVEDIKYFEELALKREKKQLNIARLDGIDLANKGYGKEDKTFKRKSLWTKVNKDQD